MRLFVAILLPDSIRDGLMNAEDVLRRQGDGNFTLRENLHLTLAFLGETSNLRGAVRAIHAVHAAQLPLTLEKVETIRDLIWMGAEQPPFPPDGKILPCSGCSSLRQTENDGDKNQSDAVPAVRRPSYLYGVGAAGFDNTQ